MGIFTIAVYLVQIELTPRQKLRANNNGSVPNGIALLSMTTVMKNISLSEMKYTDLHIQESKDPLKKSLSRPLATKSSPYLNPHEYGYTILEKDVCKLNNPSDEIPLASVISLVTPMKMVDYISVCKHR